MKGNLMMCSILPTEALSASALTHEVRLCDLCENPTLWSDCSVAGESVCVICHHADVYDGWGFNGYHE